MFNMRDFINLILEASASNMSPAKATQIFAQYGVPNANQLNPAQLNDIRKRLMKQHHTDLGGEGDAGALINSAYDTLKGGTGRSTERERSDPRYPEPSAPWAHAGYSGGMQNSAHISRQDYRDVNFIKKRMWELSKHSTVEWNIWGFDGAFLRGSTTVYGSPEIFDEMARAMVMWQTKGGNPYACRAVLVNRRYASEKEYFLIWADGRSYARKPIKVESDSFNGNPGNDHRFYDRLRTLIDELEENNGPLPDQPGFNMNGSANYKQTPIGVGDHVQHAKYGTGVVINTSVRRNVSRVNFEGENRNVKSDSLRKLTRWTGGWR